MIDRTRWVVTAAVALGIVCGARDAEARFVKTELRVPGSILWMTTGDLDGDGLTDLVFSYRRGVGPRSAKFLAIFFRKATGWGPEPDLAFAAPKNAAVFDVGDGLGDAKDELVYIAQDGVYAQVIVDRKPTAPTRLFAVASLVAQPEEDDLVTWDFLRPFAPGEPPMIVIPTRGPLRLFRRAGDEWKPWSRVEIEQFSAYDAETSTYRRDRRGGSSGRPYAFRSTTIVPNIDFIDQTGDGRLDVVTSYEDRVAVFPMLEDGTISPDPSHTAWFQIRTPEEMETRDSGVSVQLMDLDGDLVADACVSKISGGITSLATETRLYRGVKGGGFEPKAAQVFIDEGFGALVQFVDVDGDGKPEMVHPRSSVSIMAVSQMMLSKELSLELRIRRATSERPLFFEPSPAQTIETVYGLDLSVGATLRGSFPIFGHDFDGDGIRDVVSSQGGAKMTLQRGRRAKEPFESEGRITLSAPGTNTTMAIFPDVARKKRPDLVLYYVDRADLTGRGFVFTNSDE